MALNTEEGEDNLSDLREQADKAGLPFDKLAQAVAGSTDEIDLMLRVTNQQIEKQKALITGSYDDESTAARNRVKALEEVRTKLEESSETAQQATQIQADYAAAGGDDLERRAALIEAATARQEDANKRIQESNDAVAENMSGYVDAVQDAYAEAGAAIDTYVEDGVFNLQKYTEESQKQADAIASYQANMSTLSKTLSAEALSYISSLGPDAAPLLAAFVQAPLDQQQATADVWSRLGKTSTDAYGDEVQYQLDQSNFTAAARLKVDDSELQNYIRRTSVSLGVNVRPVDGTYGAGLGFVKRQY
jgi:DNA repair exonuclease SbcCD ATPase subunit